MSELAQLDLFGGPEVDLTKWPTPNDESHLARIYRYLKAGRSLTSDEAMQLFECSRLPARIYDLRELMHCRIAVERVLRNGHWIASYRMIEL